ncbi:MAG: hypothetical protein CMP75_04320 [Flavobacteriales bacterium]|nr:hypothetical protein [Flavobacteriales bacterium]|tara:strand:- start:11283 stop:12608 length:1326 start_codon:yes stop_codon:yes gene_type:complete
MKKSVVYNSILTVIRHLLGSLIGVVAIIIIARVLGKEGQGEYTLAILLPTILYTMLNGGISTATVYFLGQRKYNLEEVYSTNFISSLALSLVSFIVGLFIVFFYKDFFFKGIPQQLLLYSMLVLPLLYLQKNLQTIFQAKEDFERFNFIVILNQFGLLLFSVLFVWGLELGVLGAVLSFGFSQLLMLFVSVRLLRKEYSLFIPKSFSYDYLKEGFLYGIKGHVSNVLSFVNYRIDMFLLAFFLDNIAVGVYSIAVTLVERVWLVSHAVSSVLFARVANLSSDEERNKFTSIASRNTLFITALTGLVLLILGKWIVLILFGLEYESSVKPFLWMLPGVVLFSLGRIIANDFSGRGRPEINTYVALAVAATNLGLNFILIPIFGIIGAAMATSASYMLDAVLKSVIFALQNKVSFLDLVLIKGNDLLLYKTKWLELKQKAFKR